MAYRLGLPKTYVEHEMPVEEYVGWCRYFEARPPGWEEDRRTYLVLSALGVKQKPEEIFATLKAMRDKERQNQDPLGFFKQMAAKSEFWNPED